ncbi:MAG: TonB-dependent receptor, partial [Bacteroidales bacterium]|nr:TonB-dependent receptor [Bacteroidales bacterium]
MKRTLFVFLFISSAILSVSPAKGQEYVERSDFIYNSSGRSVLYRGRQAMRYNILFDGTYFWESPVFVEGSITLDGKLYEGVMVNVDAFGGEVQLMPPGSQTAIVPAREHVDQATMGDVRFVNLLKKGYPVSPGFYEVVHEGGGFAVYRLVKKALITNLSSSSSSGYAIESFEDKVLYFFEKDGLLMPIGKKKALRLAASPSEAGIASAMRARRKAVSLSEPETEDLAPLAEYGPQAPAELPEGDFKVGDKTIYTSLPLGFFSSGRKGEADDELLRLINAGNEMVTFANKVYEVGRPEDARGDRAVVRGTVRDVLSGEPLAGVVVVDGRTGIYGTTDNDGGFRISLPLGENVLSFSGYSLEDLKLNVVVNSDGGLDVVMKERITSLKEAVVSAESMVNHRDARMGIEKVRINTISKIPSAFGEADVLKAVLTLPGVKSVGEASSGFNVRGGSADQNLVLFNDGTIYNPSHFFGIFSAFNTDVINDIELYKSSIPAEFGGRISSVLDVRGREGNAKKVQGSLGLGLLTSRFHIEGPIKEDRTTFIVGGRTTYSNWLFNLLPENSAYSGGRASFSDLNASVTHRVNDRNTIQAYGYWSRDSFSFDGDTTFRYSNLNASVKWRHTVSGRTGLTMVTGYDRYSNVVDDNFNTVSAYSLATGVNQVFAKAGFKSVLNDRHTLAYGASAVLYDLNPGVLGPLTDSSLVAYKALARQRAIEPAVYAGDTWKPGEKLSVDMGVRFSGFEAFSPSKFYWSPE